jgi:hypothetical protein
MKTHDFTKSRFKHKILKNNTVEKAYSSILNELTCLFKKLPDSMQSAVIIDYKCSPEAKALELYKLLHPVVIVTLEAEPNLDYTIWYCINYSFKNKKKLAARYYSQILAIINKYANQEDIRGCLHDYFYADDNLDDIARYKLIGPNNYITITEQLEYV